MPLSMIHCTRKDRARGRPHSAGRLAVGTCIRMIVLVAVSWSAIPAAGCPFCGTVGQSLAQRRDEASVVAVGEAEGGTVADRNGFLSQRFRLAHLLRNDAHAAGDGATVTARVTGAVTGTAMLFGGTGVAAVGGEPRLTWTAVGADEMLLGYMAAAPATSQPAAERLRWFAVRLEHPDPAIAADAFTEFGLAPFADVRAAAAAIDPDRVRAWISEPGIDARRRGLYGLLVGIVAATTENPAVATGCVDALRHAVTAPADDFRAGFDGLLAGVLVAEGERGLDFFRDRGLFDRTARPLDQRHLLAALRFAWESLGDTIPRGRIVAATTDLLASPAVAADATVDLARYQAWDAVAVVSPLWDALGTDDPLIRRAVAGYLAACPLPTAKQALERIRERNPTQLQQALDAAALPAAR
jgi:hypothetical protein